MSGFTVVGGKIVAPDGRNYIAAGCGIWDTARATQFLTLFPDVNFIRIPLGAFELPDKWGAFITQMTNLGIVCEVEYHPWPLINAPTGPALTALLAWYTTWARWGLTLAHPEYLWFGDMNEPQGGDISTEQQAIYNAIRATGNQTPIIMECGIGAGNPNNVGAAVLRPAVYTTMRNIIWGQHVYPWINNTTNQAAFNASLLGSVGSNSGVLAAQALRSADGIVPVINEEFGPSTDGQTLDATYATCIEAVGNWAWSSGVTSGFCGWIFDPTGPDGVLNGSGGLNSPWGTALAGYMAAVKRAQSNVATPPANTNANPGNWQSFTSGGMPWFLLIPDNYNPAISYPVVLFLHQYQNESAEPQQTDPWFNTAAFRAAHPCFVVVPRCQINTQTSTAIFNWGGVDPNLQQPIVSALAILDEVIRNNNIDKNRQYITGNSMGGLGTWGVLCNANQWQRFAAAMPVSGSCYYNVGNETNIAQALKNLPVWSCHGQQDTQVSPTFDQAIMPLLLNLNPANRFTNDPNGQHDTWDTFYADPKTWNWLFSQAKGGSVSVSVPPASPTNTVVTPGKGSFSDGLGNTWAVSADGVITTNGTPDTTTANVVQLAWVGGVVWQMNASKLWWSKATPTSGWSPPTGTSLSPLPVVPPVVVTPFVTVPTDTLVTVGARVTQAVDLQNKAAALLSQAAALLVAAGKDVSTTLKP